MFGVPRLAASSLCGCFCYYRPATSAGDAGAHPDESASSGPPLSGRGKEDDGGGKERAVVVVVCWRRLVEGGTERETNHQGMVGDTAIAFPLWCAVTAP